MVDFADYFHFADDRYGVDAGLIDGVAEEAVAELEDGVLDIDGVARAIEQAVLVHIDRVVLKTAEVDSILLNLADELSGLLCASAPDEGAEGDKR